MTACAKRGCKAHKLKRGKYCLFHSIQRGDKAYQKSRVAVREAYRTGKRVGKGYAAYKAYRRFRR